MRLFRPDGEDEMSFSLGLSPITEFSLNKGVSTSCASVSSSVEWGDTRALPHRVDVQSLHFSEAGRYIQKAPWIWSTL